jgi:hypothetical protein
MRGACKPVLAFLRDIAGDTLPVSPASTYQQSLIAFAEAQLPDVIAMATYSNGALPYYSIVLCVEVPAKGSFSVQLMADDSAPADTAH